MGIYAVLGAGGGTGAACVETLVQQGHQVRAVVRDPERAKASAPALGAAAGNAGAGGRVELVPGDVTDRQSLTAAMAGCAGVIFAASGKGYWSAKDVDCQGVKNVADVAAELGGVQRVVLVSSALVTPARRFHPIRILLNNIRYSLMDNKYKGEELLRTSGVPYTVVRPGGLTNDPAGQAHLLAGQGDQASGRVCRADVAAVCVAALTDPAALNVTMELTSAPQGPGGEAPGKLAEQLKGIFRGLKPDA